MDQIELEKILDEQDRRFLSKSHLPEHDDLLSVMRSLFPMTGLAGNLFCNGFMSESVELIKHALFLYEYGYFDCAFYSLRQSVEIMNNMLLLADDEERLKQWKTKAWFPTDSRVKDLLKKQNNAYREIRETIPEFFFKYEELLGTANKYIHKQGFNTFYTYRIRETEQERIQKYNLFIELTKYTIGMVLIMVIALDPLSLALSDSDVDDHMGHIY